MKRNWIVIWGLLLLSLNLNSYGQQTSRLKDWGIPVAGEKVEISYNPKGGPLEKYQQLSGIIYMYNNYRWSIDDLTLKEREGKWETTYTLPANCAFIAVKFIATEDGKQVASDVNNDQGYVATTVSPKKMRLPGGALAWGIFRKPSLNKAPQGYFDKFDISGMALEMWVRKEMDFNPDQFNKYFDIYLAMLKLKTADSFPKIALPNVERFSKDPKINEQGYQSVWDAYSFALKEKGKADSIAKIILQKYPKGNMARLRAYNAAYNMPLDEKKLLAQEQFLKDFPIAEYKKDTAATQNFTYYNTYRQLASAYFASFQNEKLFALVPDMNFATLNEIYRWNIDRIFALSKLPIEKIYPVSKVLIEEMLKKSNDYSYMEGLRYTPAQALSVVAPQLDNKLSIHIRILTKMGKYEEALPFFSYRSEKGMYTDAALNEAKMTILDNTSGENNVLPLLEMSVKANATTPSMLDRLKKIYAESHPDLQGFDAYVESLKSAVDVQKLKVALKAKLIRVPYTAFGLKNMDGKMVNSADWKGKIVVLDFWATWCFPCKAAFPGMQLLVDRYTKDPKVGIFFISTMERSPSYQADVKKYISTSGYRFDVLFDGKNPKGGQNDRVFKSMVPIFNSSAIPRKVVLKDGLIRYTAEGYSGSPSKLLDELSYVVELLKAE
ncbi:AhpC/TSA family protein [Pedobacter sp. ok626]|uniref:TlpA family protein disulfide reductase n=1 Tax=Pedobacter sp. ok626 TaxID=1761882 RepID=UPI00088E87AD|nr:TlpA disulfide reductase family protein [Pedobacter sp. ok626]SDL65111.1 AhpC/TSA family protein [Pedobacter sp. ok626]